MIRNAEMKAASMAVEAQKQAMSETADAFRGVHLDPNAHHWDDVRFLYLRNYIENNDGDARSKMTMMTSLVELLSLEMAGNTRYKYQKAVCKTLQLTPQIWTLL